MGMDQSGIVRVLGSSEHFYPEDNYDKGRVQGMGLGEGNREGRILTII